MQARVPRILILQTRLYVSQTHTGSVGGFATSTVAHINDEYSIAYFGRYFDPPSLARRSNAMSNRVFHQWLKDHLRHQQATSLRRDSPVELKPIPEAHLFEIEIFPHKLQLVFEGNQIGAVAVQRCAQEI